MHLRRRALSRSFGTKRMHVAPDPRWPTRSFGCPHFTHPYEGMQGMLENTFMNVKEPV
jgi:hypothetical protein